MTTGLPLHTTHRTEHDARPQRRRPGGRTGGAVALAAPGYVRTDRSCAGSTSASAVQLAAGGASASEAVATRPPGPISPNCAAAGVARRRCLATRAAAGAAVDRIEIIRPDDWHLHVRDGASMRSVVPHTAKDFARAIIMPNLTTPVTTTQLVRARGRRPLLRLGTVARRGCTAKPAALRPPPTQAPPPHTHTAT
jgi:hypothetical protein